MGERGIREQLAAEVSAGGSDSVGVNTTAVCLRFARPFVQGYLERCGGQDVGLAWSWNHARIALVASTPRLAWLCKFVWEE